MSAPNIANVSTIYGKTVSLTPSNTSANVLVANSASSGKVLKINTIVASNVSGSVPCAVSVAINSNASGSGTSYPLAYVISVPANASLIVTDKTTTFYLEEDKSIVVTSAIASDISFSVSYEEMN